MSSPEISPIGGANSFSSYSVEQEASSNLNPLESKVNTTFLELQAGFSQEPAARSDHAMTRSPIPSSQSHPLDPKGILDDITRVTEEFNSMGELEVFQSRAGVASSTEHELPKELKPSGQSRTTSVAKLKDVELMEMQAIDKSLYQQWRNKIISTEIKKQRFDEVTMTHQIFTHPEKKENVRPGFMNVIQYLLKKYPQQLVSVKGMYQEKAEEIEKLEVDNREVQFYSYMATDWSRGACYMVAGEAMKKEDGIVTDEEKKKFITMMMEMGLTDEEILATTNIYNQHLLNNAVMHLVNLFPSINFSTMPGTPAFNLSLTDDAWRHPIIEGSAVLRLRNREDIESPQEYRITVNVLVTNPGSTDPNLSNVHYHFGRCTRA